MASPPTPEMEHDPTFEHEIDAYVSDEDDRPRQALRRLTTHAMSFLSRAYPNPIEEDRERLQRFHSQAISFLDRAYAEDPDTLIVEEHIPPEQLLQQFHTQAMSFLGVVPGNNNTLARIERDKARLEQHYQDAMSFLNRVDKGSGLVEEQELELATVERFQLQKYAREAMSFLDKAFREDASVMVDDEELSPHKVDEDTQIAADRAALERYDEEFGDFLSKAYQDDSTIIVEDADSETSGMEGGLYARKMAASSTSADTGSATQDDDFTDEAYTDDEFQDPQSAEGARLAVLERNLPSQPDKYNGPESSGDMGTDDSESLRHRVARYEREAEDFLEGANVSEEEEESDSADISGDIGHVLIDDDGSRVEHDYSGMVTNTRDPGEPPRFDELDDDDDDEDDCDQFGADREIDEEQQLSPTAIHPHDPVERGSPPAMYNTAPPPLPEMVDAPRAGPVIDAVRLTPPRAPRKVSPALVPLRSSSGRQVPRLGPTGQLPPRAPDSPTIDAVGISPPRDPRKVSPALIPLRSSSGRQVPRLSPSGRLPPRSPDSQNLMVDIILENRGGQPSQWSEIQLERSFYRQLPRGSTIKLRPKVSPQLPSPSHDAESGTTGSPGHVALVELQRVEQERDAALATLEEIVNERSLLAAQVSEMKATIFKQYDDDDTKSEDTQDIDLAAELKDAHETMAKLTEEMEATLFVVDKRYHDTLERAHKSEERCIRLEANASRLESEFASQGMRLSQAIAEEQRMHSMLSRTEQEFDTLRRKSEKDIQRIDESYREDNERNMRRIRELTAEVTMLQQKLNNTASSSERNAPWTPQRRLELEFSTLKRRLAESERKVVEEQLAGERKVEEELRRAKAEHDNEIDKLSSQLDRVQLDSKGVDSIKRELEREQAANKRSTEQLIELEVKLADTQNELIEARRGQVAAEAEAKHVRLRYEESLKKRISQMGHSTEMVEIQTSLQGLRDEAANRERLLQQQLEDFRRRAEQAELAAAAAEKDAQEAAEVAKRGSIVIESERQARKAAEAEVNRFVKEANAREKLAQQQKEKEESSGLALSSSRRGIRRHAGGAKDGKKKKEKAGSSDEPKKKTSHRPRLFG